MCIFIEDEHFSISYTVKFNKLTTLKSMVNYCFLY